MPKWPLGSDLSFESLVSERMNRCLSRRDSATDLKLFVSEIDGRWLRLECGVWA